MDQITRPLAELPVCAELKSSFDSESKVRRRLSPGRLLFVGWIVTLAANQPPLITAIQAHSLDLVSFGEGVVEQIS